MRKAILYARVSSKEQEKEGFSIPAQQELLRAYAKKNGFAIAQEFTDVETAKAAGRSKFGEMVQLLKSSRDTRIVLVEKTDRLYRNFRDFVTLEDLDLEIHLVKENEVISNDSRSHAKFIHGIKVLMAKNFIDNLSEEVTKGLLEKARQGEWPHQAPLGYINNTATRLTEPDFHKGPLIRRLFELYATGKFSLVEVRDKLYSEGMRSRTGKRLSKSMVESILKNSFYYGEFVWKGCRYQGNHVPLISRDLYDCVQRALRIDGKPKTRKPCFAFTGLLKCSRCGCQITAEIKKGRYVYYHCTGSKGKCDQPYMREEVLDNLLADILLGIRINNEIADWIVTALKESRQDEKAFKESELKRLGSRHENLQQRLDKAYEDRLDGVIDERYWTDVSARWRCEQDQIQQQIEKLKTAERNYVDEGSRIIELAQRAYSLYKVQEPQEKRKLLDCVLSNCSMDGLTLYPTYKKPFDLLAKGLQTQNKYPRQDSNLLPSA